MLCKTPIVIYPMMFERSLGYAHGIFSTHPCPERHHCHHCSWIGTDEKKDINRSKPRTTTKQRKPMTSLRNSYKGLKYLSKDLGRDAGLFNWSRLLDGLNARILGC